MTVSLALKALVIWVVILMLAMANGFLREFVLMPRLGTPAALVVSGMLLSALILGVTYLYGRRSLGLPAIGLDDWPPAATGLCTR